MSDKPNIVFVTSHDTGRHLGCYGVPSVHTPTLDWLAGDGARFTNFFATSAVCSPARAAMMSGRYPQRNGVMGLTHEPWLWSYRRGEKHLSHLLRDAGYHTALFHHQHEALDVKTLGFKEHLAAPPAYPNDAMPDPYAHVPANKVAGEFARFVREDAARRSPFFAQIGFFETHAPFDFGGAQPDTAKGVHVPEHMRHVPEDSDTIQDRLPGFQGSLRKMDAAVRTIYAALEETGMADNTIFAYTTDHGISFPRAETTLYDSGIGVALLMRWPAAGILGGMRCDWLLSNVDVAPTLLELAGVSVPSNLDGDSFAKACQRSGGDGPRTAIYAEQAGGPGVREARCARTKLFKLIRNFSASRLKENGPDSEAVTCPPVQLFDLKKDPGEWRNVAEDREYRRVRRDMDRRLAKWLTDVEDPILTGPIATPYYRAAMADLNKAL